MPRQRLNWVGVPQFYRLNHACCVLSHAFGWGRTFQVGSSLNKRDYRDVDVRTILPDEEFDRMFPNGGGHLDAFWSLICTAMSFYLSDVSGLPIDYQVQRQTNANEEYPTEKRNALGLFRDPGTTGD